MWCAMFFATSAAPTLRASKGETCLYSVPTCARSSSSSTGQFTARGIWSNANSAGERTSTISSKSSSAVTSTVFCCFTAVEIQSSEVRYSKRPHPREQPMLMPSPDNHAPEQRVRLTELSHGGGCGCKISPAVLAEILAKTPLRTLHKDL